MKNQPKAPKQILKKEKITQRQWRSRKRQEWNRVIKAFSDYRCGCAYCPGSDKIDQIQDLLYQLNELHGQKNWGR